MSKTVLFFDESVSMIAFGAEKLLNALSCDVIGVSCKPLEKLRLETASKRIILTTQDSIEVEGLLSGQTIESLPHLDSQGYCIRREDRKDKSSWWIIGKDHSGAMYGALDLADQLNSGTPLQHIGNLQQNPYISKRGIKFNLPLDARTPSYSDNGDAAQTNIEVIWDIEFWKEFLDEMALNRFNMLSLWNLHPFPSMVKVPEYPEIALADVKKTTGSIRADLQGGGMSTEETLKQLEILKIMSVEEKQAFWQEMMEYASDRGIDIYIITWNIFTYGTEGNDYGINNNQDNEQTIDYFRASVRAMLKTYPLIKGIGVTAGENMQNLDPPYSNEEWLWRTYGEAVVDVKRDDPERQISFIHRAHYTTLSEINEAFSQYPDTFEFSYKYSQAHMYSLVKPPFIHREGFLDELPKGKKTWLTVRDDDFYYFRWGNPDFARQYLLNMPPSYQLAGFYMGSDGIIWGRESTSTEPDEPRQSIIKKQRYSFSIWGKLAFNPNLPDWHFKNLLSYQFPEVSAQALYVAWSAASQILPLVTTFHWEGNVFDFQWYPEACYSHPVRSKGFHTVEHFINDRPMEESGLIGILDYCDLKLKNLPIKGITPIQVVRDLTYFSDKTLEIISQMTEISNKELQHILGDLTCMAYLGRYYAAKIMGAVELCFYQKSERCVHQEQAIKLLEEASELWRSYAAEVSKRYLPQYITRQGHEIVDILKLQEKVDDDILYAQVDVRKSGI